MSCIQCDLDHSLCSNQISQFAKKHLCSQMRQQGHTRSPSRMTIIHYQVSNWFPVAAIRLSHRTACCRTCIYVRPAPYAMHAVARAIRCDQQSHLTSMHNSLGKVYVGGL